MEIVRLGQCVTARADSLPRLGGRRRARHYRRHIPPGRTGSHVRHQRHPRRRDPAFRDMVVRTLGADPRGDGREEARLSFAFAVLESGHTLPPYLGGHRGGSPVRSRATRSTPVSGSRMRTYDENPCMTIQPTPTQDGRRGPIERP